MGLDRFFRRRAPAFTEYGYKLRAFQLSQIGRVEFAQWLHPSDRPTVIDQAVVDAVRKFVRAGDFVIDIGAHTGDTTVPMALAAGPAGCALALEPNPHVFKVLEKNATLNQGITHIVSYCCAATEHDGEFVFHYGDASFCNGGFNSRHRWPFYRRKYPLTIQGRNVLSMLRMEFAQWLPRLSYIKVDAEGYDHAILASLAPILVEFQPVIRTEVFRKLSSNERFALFDLLAKAGYRAHRHVDGVDPLGKRLKRGDMTREKHFDVLAIPESWPASAAA